MISMTDNVVFLLHLVALLLGFTTVILLTLGSFKYKNSYLTYICLSYFATTIMLICDTLQLFIDNYTPYTVGFINCVSAVCMSIILLSVFLLVLKLFYNNTPKWCYLIIYLLSFIPLTYLLASFFSYETRLHYLFLAITLEFYCVLGINCLLFGLRLKTLNSFHKKISKPFWIIVTFFVVTFILQFVLRIDFSVLPFFYGLWSIAFIRYFWESIFTTILEQFSSTHLVEQFHITEREKEIVDLILLGKSNKAIGAILFISEKTVKNHVYNIYKKLGINSRFELMGLFKTLTTIIAVFILSMSFQYAMSSYEKNLYPPPGQLIDISNHKMHIYAKEVLTNGTIGSIPLVILTAGKDPKWQASQIALMDWSTNSKQENITDAVHYIHWSHPGIVIARTQDMVHQTKLMLNNNPRK